MKVPEHQTPAEMNWVDYCDLLTNERYARRAQSPKPVRVPEDIPAHTEFVSTLREMARELT